MPHVLPIQLITMLGHYGYWVLIPIAVIDRPSDSFRALASPAAQALSKYRHNESLGPRLADCAAPAWVYLHGLKSPLSSTELRSHTKASS